MIRAKRFSFPLTSYRIAEVICDRVAIVFKGRLKSIGRMNELLSTRVKDYEVTVKDLPSDTFEQFEKRAGRSVISGGEGLFTFGEEKDAQELCENLLREKRNAGFLDSTG